MKSILSFLTLTFAAAAAVATPDISCKAIYRTVENDRLIETVAAMPLADRTPGHERFSVDHEGRHFSVLLEGTTSALVQIVQPPNYTQGLVMRASPDAQGRLNLAEVLGYTVYKIECLKK
ncbi:MAG: hypothetical protein KF789_10615 [Bdellovibrionaceae bacterium]|nr:hypothetical protein [Pseudobdellovibrionaceae bacterium]